MKKYVVLITLTSLLILITFSNSVSAKGNNNKFKESVKDVTITNILGEEVKVAKTDDKCKIDIIKSIKDKNELNSYKKNVEKNLTNLTAYLDSEDIILNITLAKSIDIEEFNEFVSSNKLSVIDFKARAVNSLNERITLGGKVENNKIDSLKLEQVIGQDEFKGVIAFNIKVKNSPEIIERLKNDKRVFLVNADAFLVSKEIEKKDGKKVVNEPKVNDVYWYLEEYLK